MKRRIHLNSFLDVEMFILLLLLGFSAAFLIDTRSYNRIAALFPRLVSTATLLLILGYMAQRFWILFRIGRPVPKSEEEVTVKKEGGLPGYISLVTMIGYFLAIYLIGLTWASLVYLISVPLFMGYRKYKIVILTSIMWVLAFLVVFSYILHTRTPGGVLGNFYQWITSR